MTKPGRHRQEARRAGGVVIVGVGNPLRGDDAVGHVVTLALELYAACAGMYLATAHQILPELALTLRNARLAIVVDAAVDVSAGRVVARPVAGSPVRRAVGHAGAIQDVLDLTRLVFGRAPETWAVLIGGARWDVGSPLSPAVSAAVPRALHQIDLIVAARCPACALRPTRPRRRAVARS